MNVHLTPELEELVHNKVHSGRYNSSSEVVREALRLMDERDQFTTLQKDEIRRKIDAGLASARAGQLVDGEEFMDQMLAELDDDIRTANETSVSGASRPS